MFVKSFRKNKTKIEILSKISHCAPVVVRSLQPFSPQSTFEAPLHEKAFVFVWFDSCETKADDDSGRKVREVGGRYINTTPVEKLSLFGFLKTTRIPQVPRGRWSSAAHSQVPYFLLSSNRRSNGSIVKIPIE